ncbi:hypothetical protein [Actinomadura fulvescens]|uniref:hypothetical protein n=1 Tax=Actinomadura fulvescens TaxID=46160 RepID=UPI00397E4A89
MTSHPTCQVLRQGPQLDARVRVQFLAGDVLGQDRNVTRRRLPLTVVLSSAIARRPIRSTLILTRTARAAVAVTERLAPASPATARPVPVAERLTGTRATPVITVTVWT